MGISNIMTLSSPPPGPSSAVRLGWRETSAPTRRQTRILAARLPIIDALAQAIPISACRLVGDSFAAIDAKRRLVIRHGSLADVNQAPPFRAPSCQMCRPSSG